MNLLFGVTIFENCKKYVSDLAVGLPVHDFIPIIVPDLNIFDFRIRLFDAFLQLQKVLMIFLTH